MKSRKILSAVLSVAMLLSMLPAASATSISPAVESEILSEYAGQTIAVQAVEETEDGLTSRVVDVAIPEGTTEADARTLIYATAFGWDMGLARSGYYAVTSLGSKHNFTIGLTETEIIQRTLASELHEIYVTFIINSLSPSTSNIQVKLENNSTNTSDGWLIAMNTDVPDNRIIREIVFKAEDISMEEQDQITIYAKSNGTVGISTCNVTGYYYY